MELPCYGGRLLYLGKNYRYLGKTTATFIVEVFKEFKDT